MEGSIFPNGVLVDNAALRRTDVTKADQILRSRMDTTSGGVFTGGVVTPSGTTAGLVNVAAFSGYTPNGEYVSGVAENSIALSDDTLNVENYVCAVYTEVETHSQPHETDGQVYATYSEASSRIRVFTVADFENPAVLATSDDNLANDAQDRCLILAKVTAAGAGIAIPSGNIDLPSSYSNLLYASPFDLVTLAGVTITSIDSTCETGTATFSYDGSLATPELSWISPGGAIGAGVPLSADGAYVITDAGGITVNVQITMSTLPTTAAAWPITETTEVLNLYYQEIPRLTAEDDFHRNLTGSGIVTANNPHGLSANDLAGNLSDQIQEHQDVQHCNGIWRETSNFSTFLGYSLASLGNGDRLTLVAAGGDIYYINGNQLDTVSPLTVYFDYNVYGTVSKYIELWLSSEGALTVETRAAFPASRTCTGTAICDMSVGHPTGTYVLSIDNTSATEYVFTWGTAIAPGVPVTVENPTTTSVAGQMIRLFSSNGTDWVDVWVGSNVGVGDDILPALSGAGVSDNVTISAYALANTDEYMRIYSFPYYYVGTYGYIGFQDTWNSAATGEFVDHRTYGNLCWGDLADQALEYLAYRPTSDYNPSGILYNRTNENWAFGLSSTGLNISIGGGEAYIRGKRVEYSSATTYGLAGSNTYIIWLGHDGTMHRDLIGSFGGGTLQEALYYILGSSYLRDPAKYDGNTYATSPEMDDRPQMGVPLWQVTTGLASVSDSVDISHAVGSMVEAWTVASRSTSCAAAFDNIFAAFAYADYWQNLGADGASNNVDIKIIGDNTLDRDVTQPLNVDVFGSINSDNITLVSHSNSTGVWTLSPGCSVKGLRCSITGDNTVLFDIDDFCTVESCYYASSAATDDWFMTANSANVNNCNVKDNRVNTISGFFKGTAGSLTSYFWRIDNNTIAQGPHASGSTALYLTGSTHTCLGNKVVTVNTGATNTCVGGVLYDSNFSVNTIVIGDSGGGASVEYGIDGLSFWECIISENVVERDFVTGSTSNIGLGIRAGAYRNIIGDNVIKNMGVGIYIVDPVVVAMTGTKVCDNQVLDYYHRGILLEVTDDCTGVSIDNNVVLSGAKSAATDAWPGTLSLLGVSGIEVYMSAVDVNFRNLSICGNKLNNITSSVALTAVQGINIELSPANSVVKEYAGFNISNNTITNINGTGASAASVYVAGIHVTHSGTADVITAMNVNNNSIDIESVVTAGGLADVYGIYVDSYVSGLENNINISGNAIDTVGASTAVMGVGIHLDASNANISGNTIETNWVGISLSSTDLNTSISISGNTIESNSQGVFAKALTYSTISGNNVVVNALNEDASDYGRLGTHGINLGADCAAIQIASNNVKITANGADVLADSSCVYIDPDAQKVSITSCTFSGSGTNKAGTGSDSPSLVVFDFDSSSARNHTLMNCFFNINAVYNGLLITDSGITTGTTVITLHIIGNHFIGDNSDVSFNNAGAQPAYIWDELGRYDAAARSVGTTYMSNTVTEAIGDGFPKMYLTATFFNQSLNFYSDATTGSLW